MVEAVRNQDIKVARQAHIRLGGIEVPLHE